ncbi:hypothetical protein INT47_010192 [Mucor saturninus]|uniref:DH domain-containing protein n=1 Tax=Mucor saturninus TaxID=64648 RepID=A0A8H7RC68_9FUNG|nr:hypothetical protein INT47_010192 [Mucor saturninus]
MHRKAEENYNGSKISVSDISTISSNNSQRYSDNPLGTNDFGQFDIIDDLDYDDVDDGLIVDQELLHQYREAIIRQLYEGEKKFLETLEFILNTYLYPLRKNTKTSTFNFLGMKKAPCTEKEMIWLFSNIEALYKVHIENMDTLEERLSIWGPTQIISDIIQTRLAQTRKAYINYFDQYGTMITTFERLSRYQPFKKFIETVESNSKGVNLLMLLKSPVDCVERYVVQLTKLADSTSTMHPDYIGLMQCKQRVQVLDVEFKAPVNDALNVDKVYQIHLKMTGQPFGVKAERRIILQDNFTRPNRLSGEETCYFLFSDMLVFARQKSNTLQYKGHILLQKSKVRPNVNDFSVEIICPFQGVDSLNTTFMGSPTTHVIRTLNKIDQTKWITCLEAVITKLQ